MPMPKQKKTENKNDYLKRCTQSLIDAGDDPRTAYRSCAQVAFGADKGAMFLLAPVSFGEDGEPGTPKKRTFMMTAKTGAPIVRWGQKLVIDVKGMRTEKKMPVLRQHEADRIVGFGAAFKDGSNLYVEGEFSSSTPDAQEVLDLADEGYPWQTSIGVWAEEIKFIEVGQKTKINGLDLEGPAEIWTKSFVREASFVSLGADPGTAAIALDDNLSDESPQKKENAKMDIHELKKDFPEVYAEVIALGMEEGKAAFIAEGHENGVKAERDRVKMIIDAHADEAATKTAIDDGTPANDAFKIFFEAEKAKRADTLAALRDNATDPQGQNQASDSGPRPFLDLVAEYQAEKKSTKAEAMKAIAAKFPESHKAFLNIK